MKRFLALTLAILMVLCMFASCGGNTSSENTELLDDGKQQIEDNGQSGSDEIDKTENGGACAHVDDDKNHSCDKCNNKMTDCVDESKDHKCDVCGNKLTDCADSDNNHACDICNIKLSDCADINTDHNCDLCGADMSIAHIAGEGKHTCDYCGAEASECVDNNSDHNCDDCGIIISTHNYQDGYCVVCGAEAYYKREEKKMQFGLYPQTKITYSGLISKLNALAGTLPTRDNAQAWTSYGYYVSGNVSDFMWYIDVDYNGAKYRGVYFTSYRMKYTTSSELENNSYQSYNGYTTNTVYWFKYEPITWTILSENLSDGTVLILCDMIIDSQHYDYNGSYSSSNNYAESTIRKWLNETFYNTAFSELQKQMIMITTVDNGAESTLDNTNIYACENTQDKIFLLSFEEVNNVDYGFSADFSDMDIALQKKTTDYAQAQGAFSNDTEPYGIGIWWLRSPSTKTSYFAYSVSGFSYEDPVYRIDNGVVPALWIKL